MYRRRNYQALLSYTLLILALFITLFPILWIVLTSLKTTQETMVYPPKLLPSKIQLDAYVAVIREKNFPLYFKNSAIVSLSATLACMFFATLAGYGFSRFKFPGSKAIFLFILMATMFPAVLMIVPYFLMLRTIGLLNTYIAYVLAYTSFSLPFATWMMRGFFESIPKEIDESGLVDGCTWFTTFRRLCLPLAGPGMASTAIYSFLLSWNQYLFALTLTTKQEKYMLPVGIANLVGEYWVDWSVLMAASVLAMIPVIIFNIFMEKYLVRGMTAGAVKG
jgi:ABC-type glycerol-3-phosphate transport system permease component